MDLLSERQSLSQIHLREKYMEEIRLRKLKRDERRQERIASGFLDDPPKRGDSASSDSSKDEGVQSNGEKAEDDINDDDLTQSGQGDLRKYAGSEVDEDEDEGMGSMAGEKIKDDPDDPEEERSRPLTAISENKIVEPSVDDAASTGYNADIEDIPDHDDITKELSAEEPQVEQEEAETEPVAAEVEPEAAEVEPEAAEGEPDAAEAEPEETEAEPEVAEVETEADKGEVEPEQIEAEVGSVNKSDEGQGISTAEKPPDTSRRKRKKKIFFDMDKVTANRKPLSIRTETLEKPATAQDTLTKKTFIKRTSNAQPVSSKKENENFKPHLKSKYETQRQNRLKYKIKLKKPSVTNNAQTESSNPDGSTDSSPAAPPIELTVSDVSPEEEAEKGDFVNPLMDHSMERPVAPHQRKKLESTSARKMLSGTSPKTEVWVPGEDQLYVYSYSSLPRLLHIKRLGGKRVATTYSNDTDPNSSFRLKNRSGRVIRGTNFGKDGAPKWNPYFAYARCLSANDYAFYETEEMRQRREEFRERMKSKAKERREYLGVSNIFRTTNGPTNYSFTSLTQLDSSVSAEVAVIKALVSNILREAAVEVAAEAEADGAKMEQLAARRLSLMGEADATKPEDAEDEVRKEPEGEETPAEDTEATPQEEPEEVPPDEPEESPPDDPEEAPPDEPEAEPAEEEASAESEEVPAEYVAESEEATAKGEDQAEMEEVPAG